MKNGKVREFIMLVKFVIVSETFGGSVSHFLFTADLRFFV
jgi:hypothetical protein